MQKIYWLLIILVSLNSCELIVIGTKKTKPIVVDLNQKSALGTVFLFKAELDSNNSYIASDLIARADGTYFLAYDRYENSFEVDRIKRQIRMMPVTDILTDTLEQNMFRYRIEYDYIKQITYTAKQIDSNWFIIKYQIDK